jgi:hypothetical protein
MHGKIETRKKSMRGASIAEFIIAFPVVFILALLCLQLTLMYRAKLAHNYAVQEAVRIGAMSNGRFVPRFVTDILDTHLGRCGYAFFTKYRKRADGKTARDVVKGLGPGCSTATKNANGPAEHNAGGQVKSPLMDKLQKSFANKEPRWAWDLLRGLFRYGDSSVLQGYINGIMPFYVGRDGHTNVASAQIEAFQDAMWNSCILYHNPTQAAFIESGVIELQGLDYGILRIPADYMRFRTPLGVYADDDGIAMGNSKLKGDLTDKPIHENTILSIEILWSYPLDVPIANSIIIGLTKLYDSLNPQTALHGSFHDIALERGRFPFSAIASARAQGSLHWHPFYPLGTKAPPPGTGGWEVFDAVVALWNLIINNVTDHFDPAEPQIGFCLSHAKIATGETANVNPHWWGEQIDRK